jgi:hypothetical protein
MAVTLAEQPRATLDSWFWILTFFSFVFL